MIVVGTAGALGLGAPFWAPPVLGTLPVFRVERVEVAGNVFVQHDDVLQLAAIAPEASVWDDGSVWEARVRSHALVREARVRRVGMRGIDVSVCRELIRIFRRCDAEAIPERLQFAVAGFFTEHAEVIPFHEQHVDEVSSKCP